MLISPNVDGLTELFIALICSKKKKKLLWKVAQYWEEKAKELHEWSDCAPETDFWDSGDHRCQPKDAQAWTSWSPKKIFGLVFPEVLYCRVKGAVGIVS